jgi:hypothetical protein
MCIATGYGVDGQGTGNRFPAGTRDILLSTVSRPALEPTQPPIQGLVRDVRPGLKRLGHDSNHFRLEPRSRICGAVPHSSIPLHCVMLN